MAPVHQVSLESAYRFVLWSVAIQIFGHTHTNIQTKNPDNKGYLANPNKPVGDGGFTFAYIYINDDLV